MRKYITDLTTALIQGNDFEALFNQARSKAQFVDFTKMFLANNEVGVMNPSTLGKIMYELQSGDVMATHEELFGENGIKFQGDTNLLLRDLVSMCLACVIRDRLDPEKPNHHVTPYSAQTKA